MTDDLNRIYQKSRGYKDEVLSRWIDNLSQHAMSGTSAVKAEALRRIDFIERELMSQVATSHPATL